MNDVTDQIINTLRAAGIIGLRVNELTKKLADIDSKIIVQNLNSLINEGMVMQKQETDDTRYFIRGQFIEGSEHGHLSDLNGCPCFHCLRISKCGVRQPDSPIRCSDLEDWMISSNTS